jgi:hypothetical protein
MASIQGLGKLGHSSRVAGKLTWHTTRAFDRQGITTVMQQQTLLARPNSRDLSLLIGVIGCGVAESLTRGGSFNQDNQDTTDPC